MILLHLLGWVACLEQVYVLHTSSPTHIRFLYSEWGTELGVKSSEKPLPSDIQWTNGHLKHCLFLGSFCPQVLVILLPARSHCCGLLLLWDVIANVLVWCLAYWSSCCPAFLAKRCRVSWRGKTSSGNLIWQGGRSPSSFGLWISSISFILKRPFRTETTVHPTRRQDGASACYYLWFR